MSIKLKLGLLVISLLVLLEVGMSFFTHSCCEKSDPEFKSLIVRASKWDVAAANDLRQRYHAAGHHVEASHWALVCSIGGDIACAQAYVSGMGALPQSIKQKDVSILRKDADKPGSLPLTKLLVVAL
jgi:hypothetical protein